jgi:hypothetical protein
MNAELQNTITNWRVGNEPLNPILGDVKHYEYYESRGMVTNTKKRT